MLSVALVVSFEEKLELFFLDLLGKAVGMRLVALLQVLVLLVQELHDAGAHTRL